jgi:hypothetical protein
MRSRDPKRDPQPGDVVCVGFDCRSVLGITHGGAIHYRGDRHEGMCGLAMWRAWCLGSNAFQERRFG